MSANLEISAVATRLQKVSFHSKPKEGQYQRMFKLPDNCTHFTRQQGNAQNPSIYASTVHEHRTSSCTSWILKRQRNQRSNCQHLLDHGESKGVPGKHLLCFTDYTKTFDCADHNQLWKIFREIWVPDHLTCLLRNLYGINKQQLELDMEQQTGSKLGRSTTSLCMVTLPA